MSENQDFDSTTPNSSSPGPPIQEEDRARAAQAEEMAGRSEIAFRTAVLFLGAVAVCFALELFLAFQLGVWQMYAVTGITGAFGIAMLISLGLMRRGHPDLGMGIIIGGMMLAFLIASLLVANLGLVFSLTVVLLSSTLAAQTLPQRYASRAIFASIVAGIATLLLDLYGGDHRLSVPLLQTFLPVIIGLLLMVYGVFIAREFYNYTLRAKLIASFVGVSAAAVIAVSFVSFRAMRSAFEEQIGANYTVEAGNLGRYVVSFFEARVAEIVALATVDVIEAELETRNQAYSGDADAILAQILALDEQWRAAGDDAPLVQSIIAPDPALNPTAYKLAEYLKVFPEQTEIFVTDRHGATLGATGRLTDYYQADEGWWQAAWNDGQGALYISDPEYDESAGVTAALIAVPVFEGTGEILGIVRSTLILDRLFEVLEATRYGETGHAVLFDGSAEVLYEPVIQSKESSVELPLDLRQRLINKGHYIIETDVDGDQSLFARQPIIAVASSDAFDLHEAEATVAETVADLGWAVVVRQETEEAFAPITRLSKTIQLVGIVILVLVGLVGLFGARLLTGPILALTEAADAVSGGNLDVELIPLGRDEIGRLTTSFGNMTRQLKQTLSSLQERNAHLQATVQQYSDCMAEVGQGNLEARIILQDDAAEQGGPLVTLGHNLNHMTANLQRMIEQERAQRETIQAQRQAIQELSTPVIPVMDTPQGGIVVLPLIGSIDSQRAKDVMRTLLVGIRVHRARVVILDITGVPIVDSGVATHLDKTIQAARLKGARTIITGISDAVAEAVVDLGIDWSELDTLSDLQTGLVAALKSTGVKLGKM
jgi:anti-anti-sigma regulatory factor/HAMP domain-containing protein